jgi:glucose/arabinose dehydrogenase
MRIGITVLAAAAAAVLPVTLLRAQITDPLPPTWIQQRGLAVEIKDVVRLPKTRDLRPADQDVTPSGWARPSFVRELPDGRTFANDSRGFLYLLDGGNEPTVYADVAAAFPNAIYNRLESGFIGFDFHPDFARNGLFYTVHSERAQGNPAVPNFMPPGFTAEQATRHNVITEWHATDPRANKFAGTRRELLRIGHVVENLTHPVGNVEFNPTAKPGSPDYGLVYTSGSDLGFSNGGGPNANNPKQTQRLDSVVTAILRFDPRSPTETKGVKGLGDYTIPAINRFQADGDPKTLGEIYAYGFRNAHRLSWDMTDGTMFASDIGMSNIEEINIVHEGGNYGWMRREGYWENGMWRPGGALVQLYELPADELDGRTKDGMIYPVAIYDHSEGVAISGGFAYYGKIPQLKGKFVFGDIARGRLFATDTTALKAADDGIPRTVAPIEEIQLYRKNARGERENVTLSELIQHTNGGDKPLRADLHLSRTRDGELYVTSRQDGMIRMLVADSSSGSAPSARQ